MCAGEYQLVPYPPQKIQSSPHIGCHGFCAFHFIFCHAHHDKLRFLQFSVCYRCCSVLAVLLFTEFGFVCWMAPPFHKKCNKNQSINLVCSIRLAAALCPFHSLNRIFGTFCFSCIHFSGYPMMRTTMMVVHSSMHAPVNPNTIYSRVLLSQ